MRLALGLSVLLAGCAAQPHAILRDPVSGQTVNCTYMSEVNTPISSYPVRGSAGRAIGAGAADGIASAFREQDCIASYRAVGFQYLQPAQPPAREIDVRSPTCGTSKGC